MDVPVDNQDLQEDESDATHVPRLRRCKRRIVQLLNLRPDVWFHTSAVIGPPDNPTYIIEIQVDGQTFQGISQSKKKAKVMAAEYALMHLGEIDSLTESPPPLTSFSQLAATDDFSSDLLLPTKVKSKLLRDFSRPEGYDWYDRHECEIELVAAASKKPTATASEKPLTTSLEKQIVDICDDDDLPEELRGGNEDLMSQLIGKNPLTIIGEMQIDATYILLARSDDPLNPMFAVTAVVDGEAFRAAGTSKKLAKARAACEALRKLYNLEFRISENGMPIYEGDQRIWQHYKTKLEREAAVQLQPRNNPLMLMMEYFPDARIEEGPVLDGSPFLTASVSIFDDVYSGVGTTMLEAKMNAAANAVDVLQRNRVIAARENELRVERREANWMRQHGEGPPDIPRYDKRMFAVQKNAAAKLRVIYRNIDFMELREMRIRNTDLKAFVVAIVVEGRSYVGVGKTKKEARCEAAEQALRHLRLWSAADEDNKCTMLYGTDSTEDPVELVKRLRVQAGLPPYSNVPPRHPLHSGNWDVPAGHPPYSENRNIPEDQMSSADNDHFPGSWNGGGGPPFISRGPLPPTFRGPRPPMFRGRFDNPNHGPRPFPPRPFGSGPIGERPNLVNAGADKPNKEGYDKSYDGMASNRPGFGRGHDTGSRGRGNMLMTRGISRGQVIPPPPPGSQDRTVTAASQKIPAAPGAEKINRFSLPPKVPVPASSHSEYQAHRPEAPNTKAGMAPTGAGDNNFTGQMRFSVNTSASAVRNAAPQANPVTGFNTGMVASSAPGALHTSVPVCSPWNAVPPGQQQTNTTFSTQSYPNTAHSYPDTTNNYPNAALSTSTASNFEQFNANAAWQGMSQADYLTYYNNYMQNIGVSDTSAMPASQTGNNSFPPSGAVQSGTDYASQAMAYASYYSAFYGGGAGGFADPNQTQMYNYMYPYGSNQPT